jgi:hypothetical protein
MRKEFARRLHLDPYGSHIQWAGDPRQTAFALAEATKQDVEVSFDQRVAELSGLHVPERYASAADCREPARPVVKAHRVRFTVQQDLEERFKRCAGTCQRMEELL